MTDERIRGVHLSDKQLVFVFMAATVVAVMVFLFGVLVGRGVQHARGPLDDSSTAAAGQVVSDGTPAEPPVADGVPRQEADTSAGGGDRFVYPELLGRTTPGEPPKASAGPAPAPPPQPTARERVANESAAPEVPADPVPTATPRAVAAPYTVQLAAVKSRAEADTIVKQLKTKGYDAFVLEPDSSDRPAVYRVRIGSFKDRRQAEILAQNLLRDVKRYKPWVTR